MGIPGENANGAITVGNGTATPASVTLTVSLVSNFDDVKVIATQKLTLAAGATQVVPVRWHIGGGEEFGRELRAEIVDADGKLIDRKGEYFTIGWNNYRLGQCRLVQPWTWDQGAPVFPVITLVAFATLGLLLASLIRKKGMAVVVAIVVFFVLSLVGTIATGLGWSEAYKVNDHITSLNVAEYMSVGYKVLILLNPSTLVQGTYQTVGLSQSDLATMSSGTPIMYDALGGVLLGFAMIAALFVLGYLIFSRERPAQTPEEVTASLPKEA
jgi:hypothetical protein